MKITIESTSSLVEFPPVRVGDPPVQCRVWDGKTASGTDCKVFVHRVAVRRDADNEAFERELAEQLQPGQVIPLRFIL